jgi:hypothetical protein
MRKYLFASLIFLTISCQQKMFGVDEATWTTLNEQERDKVIDGYNKRREIELANRIKREEKELENERHRQEVEAQTAPFYAAADAISSICKGSNECSIGNRIQAISRKAITIQGTEFEISPYSKMSDAWLKGQKVRVSKNEESLLYSVHIKNLDNGEIIAARKR